MAGIGGFLTGIFGSENEFVSRGHDVDRQNYRYGGSEAVGTNIAEAHRKQGRAFRDQALESQNRQGTSINYGNADYANAQSQYSRGGQVDMANQMARRATGQGPTMAEQAGARSMQRAMAQQGAMAASARGPGALAAAQRNAANNMATTSSSMGNDINLAAAQERQAAEQAAFGAYGNLRQGDMASQQLAAQQAQYAAALQDAQRARNDTYALGLNQMGLGYNQLEHGVRSAQLGGNMNYEAQESANKLASQSINAGIAGQNAKTNQENATGIIGTAAMLAGGAAMMSDERAKVEYRANGGFVAAGRPYMVGEQGPELMVPSQSGAVIPNHALGGSTSGLHALSGPRFGPDPNEGSGRLFQSMRDVQHMQDAVQPDDSGDSGGLLGGMAGSMMGSMMSDARAKRDAFQEGVLYGESTMAGKPDPLPDYMRGTPAGATGPKPLVVTRNGLASRIDPKAHGEPVPESERVPPPWADVGAREVERGRPSFASRMQPKKDVTYAPLESTARSMAGSEYAYKPEFTPPGQAPGERNVGPMAQNMAADPVARNAVKADPRTGMLMLDQGKMVKTLAAVAADQQRQNDEQKQAIATLASRMRRKK